MKQNGLGLSWQVWCVVAGTLAMLSCGGGAPVGLSVQVADEELSVGASTALTLSVRDTRGAPVANVPVRLSTDTPGTILRRNEVTTDAAGTATVTVRVSDQAGANRVTVVAGSVSASVEVRGVAGPPASVTVTADPARVVSGRESIVAITVTDGFGNRLPGVALAIAPTSRGASVDATTAETDAAGQARVRLTTAATPGANVVEVRTEGLEAAVVTVPGSRLADIAVRPEAAALESGQRVTFEATAVDPDGHELEIDPEWSVTGDIGTLDELGTLTATVAGTGTVVATARGISGATRVTVAPGPARSVEVLPAEVRVASGDSQTFRATVRDAAGNETPAVYQWSVTPDLGELDEAGVLQAIRTGTATVVATAGGVSGEAVVEVTPGPLVGIDLEPRTVVVEAGGEQQFEATGRDAAGNPVALTAQWSLSSPVGRLDDTGLLRGVRAGAARLVVASGGLAASADIEVVPGPLVSLLITPSNPEVPAGTTLTFSAVGRDAGGNDVPVTPDWSLAAGLGTIDSQGLLTAGRAGEGRLVARSGDITAATDVRVVAGRLTGLEIEPTRAELAVGASQAFVVTGFDDVGNQTPVAPAWRVTEGAGTIDATGTFTSAVAGVARVSATLDGVVVSADVAVAAGPLTSIAVTPSELTIDSGAEQAFTAIGRDQYGNDLPIEPTWTVTGGVGRIETGAGGFQAVASGAGSVVATVGEVSGIAAVTVSPGPLATIRLGSAPEVSVGETVQVGWDGADAHGNEVSVTPAWRVTGDVGTIDDTGLFRASSPGTGRVIAQVGAITGEAPMRVLAGALASLRIARDPDGEVVRSGETIQLSVTGTDRGGNAVDAAPRWQVDGRVGTIDRDGRFTATRAGEGVIRATAGPITADSRVRVEAGDLASIVVSPTDITVPAATTQVFTAAGQDAHGNPVRITPDWSLTPGFGRLDAGARFTGTRVGRGMVSATVGGVVGTANVETVPGALTALAIVPADIQAQAGDIVRLTTTGTDAHGNTTAPGGAVEWRVSGNVGTVDSGRGVFTAVTAGRGQVSARTNGIRAVADVRVVPGDPSADDSTVTVSATAVPADGATVVEVTATVRDAFRNPVPGLTVAVTSSRPGDTIESSGTTDAQGVVTARMTSRTPGQSVVRLNTGPQVLASSEEIVFQ